MSRIRIRVTVEFPDEPGVETQVLEAEHGELSEEVGFVRGDDGEHTPDGTYQFEIRGCTPAPQET